MLKPPYDPRAVANLLLDLANNESLSISNLTLQKLLYFAHAHFLIRTEQPLVRGGFEAWEYGPVQPAVYQAFKSEGSRPLTIRAQGLNVMTGQARPLPPLADPDIHSHLREILRMYGRLPPGLLIDMSHVPKGPWATVADKARAKASVMLGMRIPDSVIRERFTYPKVTVELKSQARRLDEDTPLVGIDLARFAACAKGEALERALRKYNAGVSVWSYEPVRQSTADILDARMPLLGCGPFVPWSNIALQIARACNKGEAQVKANVGVGKTLFDAARRLGWRVVKVEMGRLSIGIGGSVRYWSDVVIEDEDRLFVPFFDHRRSDGVANASMRQIVFSMQHLWIRERNPDLMDARLAVVRFPSDGDDRGIHLDFHSEAELLAYDELEGRVRNVYETWARVSTERTHETRRTGTGGETPFGF